MTEQITPLPIKVVDPSATNPRKTFPPGPLQELAESIARQGVIQPLIVRNKGAGAPQRYEIVAGERRWRASKLAKLDEVPCIIRKLDDKQVAEIQLIENIQRADLDPLEEAEGFQRLITDHKMPVDKLLDLIKARVNKGRSYIYGRLKLLQLPESAKEALREQRLNASIALLIARIPDPKLQKQATEEILSGQDQFGRTAGECMSERQADAWIRTRYMVRLKDCPFDPENKKLVPEAGPCSACPKRTGNMKKLFPDLKATDVCTDPTCFQRKREAAIQAQIEEAKADGMKVLPDKESKKLFNHGYLSGPEYMELESRCYDDAKQRPWRDVLGKHCPTITIARDPDGNLHELVSRKEVDQIVKEHNLLPESKEDAQWKAEQEKVREAKALRDRAGHIAMARVVEAIDANVDDVTTIDHLHFSIAHQLIENVYYGDPTDRLLKRREITVPKGGQPRKIIEEHVNALRPDQRLTFIFEWTHTAMDYQGNWNPEFVAVAQRVKVDLDAILKSVEAEAEAKAARKSAPAAKGKSKAAKN